jgi:hypothetical protein
MGEVVKFPEQEDTKLTDSQIDAIADVMNEAVNESEALKAVSDMPSNNGVETSSGEEKGYEAKVNVSINSENGVIAPTLEENDTEDELNALDFDKLVEQAEKGLTESDLNVDITAEDLAEQVKKETVYFKDLDLTNDEIIELLQVVKRYQNKENFNIFKAFPAKIQEELNKYLGINGVAGFSVEANTTRNTISEIILDEFIHNISLNKYTMDFQKEMDALENKINEEFSKMYMDYSKERENYIKSIMEGENIDETKKEAIGNILDSINDGYALERVKKAAGKIRIKHIELEKPKKAFDNIINKYSTSTQNIYSPYTAYNVLVRHLKDKATDEDVLKFFIVLCKFCMNYSPMNPVEHAFMYYAMYNPILLDVYKGEEYDNFSEGYLGNVLEVINIINGGKNNESTGKETV